MIQVTERAKEKLKGMLDNLHTQPGDGWRLEVSTDGEYGLIVGTETEGDQVVRYGETNVLLVDGETTRRLDGAVVDVRDSEEGQQLTLRRKQES